VLSDYEQRVLEEIERCYEAESRGTVASSPPGRRRSRPPGIPGLTVLGCGSVLLMILGAAVAALALATAGAIVWVCWWLWVLRAHGDVAGASLLPRAGQGGRGSIRGYLRWLSEAE
jgi:hypothetical protein